MLVDINIDCATVKYISQTRLWGKKKNGFYYTKRIAEFRAART